MITQPASVAQAKKVMEELTANGANFITWTKDGPGDSVKIEIEAHGKEFTVAVEAVDNLSVMDSDYNWTCGLATVTEVLALIEKA